MHEDSAMNATQSLGNHTTEAAFVPPECMQRKRRIGKLAKVENAITKLQKIAENRPSTSSSSNCSDEYDLFAQHIAGQMRKLPVRSFILLQEKFQSLITQERLKCITPQSPVLSGASSSYSATTDEDMTDYSVSLLQEESRIYTQLY